MAIIHTELKLIFQTSAFSFGCLRLAQPFLHVLVDNIGYGHGRNNLANVRHQAAVQTAHAFVRVDLPDEVGHLVALGRVHGHFLRLQAGAHERQRVADELAYDRARCATRQQNWNRGHLL